MKILYVAKHNSGGNDDEGAIEFALRKLGHEVDCAQERSDVFGYLNGVKHQFVLFHHWANYPVMHNIRRLGIPLVFWNFDLVEWDDPTLEARNVMRRTWMREVMKVADIGFCTDGDWVAKHPDRLVWLPQGFDERQKAMVAEKRGPSILFTGIGRGGGTQRESFVTEMQDRYGSEFIHYTKGLHGDKLAKTVAEAKIVVAPDSPVTDRYTSNRAYNVMGMGGFLIHPYTKMLDEQYGNLLPMYEDRKHLHDMIHIYLGFLGSARQSIADIHHKRTLEAHTYLRRCEILVATVQARLGV